MCIKNDKTSVMFPGTVFTRIWCHSVLIYTNGDGSLQVQCSCTSPFPPGNFSVASVKRVSLLISVAVSLPIDEVIASNYLLSSRKPPLMCNQMHREFLNCKFLWTCDQQNRYFSLQLLYILIADKFSLWLLRWWVRDWIFFVSSWILIELQKRLVKLVLPRLGKNEGSVFECGVLQTIFGTKKDEVTQNLSKLHSVELHNLYHWSDGIRMIKSRIMRKEGGIWHVLGRGEVHTFCGGETWEGETTCKA